jgi:ribosomal protein S14
MKLNRNIEITPENANCQYELRRISETKASLTLICKCGKTHSTIEILDPNPLLTERIFEALETARQHGKPEPLPRSFPKTFSHYCPRCGRHNTVSLKYSLTRKFFKELERNLNQATEKRVYKRLITLETRLKACHLSNVFGDGRDLLFARCGSCLQTIPLNEAIRFFENLCEAVPTILKSEDYPEPRTFEIEDKCPHCLNKISGKITIGLKRPETAKELIEAWESWTQTRTIPSTQPQARIIKT